MGKHIFSILVTNKPGVMTRVSSMFTRRGFNIDTLTVGETESPEFSRITVSMIGDDYAKDIRRFADGDAELEEKFFSAYEQLDEVQARYIREYAEANSLPITAYREYGSDPVPLQ